MNKFQNLVDITVQVEQAKKEAYTQKLRKVLYKHNFAEEDVEFLALVSNNDEALLNKLLEAE